MIEDEGPANLVKALSTRHKSVYNDVPVLHTCTCIIIMWILSFSFLLSLCFY